MAIPDAIRSVDDLRARLRELGYLDAGVDRFVLAPVQTGRGLVAIAWRSSVRIGLLIGLLVGPSTAASLDVWLPGLVIGIRDAAILAGYLGLLLGAGAASGAFVAVLVAGALARRLAVTTDIRPRALAWARSAGGIVAALCLAYLVLWWRSLSPAGAVWSNLAWTAPALAAAAGVSLLLGHAVFLMTLAVVAHETRIILPELRGRRRSWSTTAMIGGLTVIAAAVLLLAAPREDGRVAMAPFRPSPAATTGIHITLLAIDGFDPAFLDRVASRDRAPRLSRLVTGARAVMAPGEAHDPARTWTSLATGQPAGIHGISSIETRRVSGIEGSIPAGQSRLAATIAAATDLVRLTRPAVASALDRRSKTFWEVASEYGRRTAVVAWWATWPAPDATGIVLTDRATLRLEHGGNLDGEVAPPALFEPLRAAWSGIWTEARARAIDTFPGSADPVVSALRRAAELDRIHVELARRVADRSLDLLAVYLPGLDIAQYALLTGPGGAGLPPLVAAARVEALERYYGFLDETIAPLVDAHEEDDVVILVTDPGRSPSPAGGILAVSGAAARTGARLDATTADVMPSVLYLLGVPASGELPGRPLTGLVTAEIVRRLPVRTVPTYGQRMMAFRPRAGTPLDREMIDRLRSLGYVR